MGDVEKIEKLRIQLAQKREEHRDLDAAIEAMGEKGGFNALQIQRLKRRKLALKDEITRLEDKLHPDIIA